MESINDKSTIFIAIASYVDFELYATIMDCIEKATDSARLHFGICLQWDNQEGLTADCIDDLVEKHSIKTDKYFYKAADGIGWARNKAQKLYSGETYFLQIDAHTRFLNNWDTILIEDYEDLRKRVEKPIISFFPPDYKQTEDGYQFKFIEELDKINIPKITAVTEDCCFEYMPHNEQNTNFQNIQISVLDGSFVFTNGEWSKEIEQDPEHYYLGEEVALSIRSFTSGYDIYSPKQIIAWHGSHRLNRRKHFEEQHFDIVRIKHQMSMLRLKALIEGKDLGVFGLGKHRRLTDYLELVNPKLANI